MLHKPTFNASRRVCVARSAATSHANTAIDPRPQIPRHTTADREQGPSRLRVVSPEQPTEPGRSWPRSHSQGRDARMNTSTSMDRAALFVGVDVSLAKLD